MVKFGKTDANQAEIVAAYRDCGISVAITSDVGGGFPDLVVGGYHQKRDRNITVLVEVKTEGGTLTLDQVEFHETWRGEIYVVRNITEALAIFGIDM